jgi:hypothetical protein
MVFVAMFFAARVDKSMSQDLTLEFDKISEVFILGYRRVFIFVER